MSENKITTNRIEEVLLKNKQEEFSKEIEQIMRSLETTLCKYLVGIKEVEREEFSKWFKEKLFVPAPAHWGNKLLNCNSHPSHYPVCVNSALLRQAVDTFIKSVESTKEVIDGLEL